MLIRDSVSPLKSRQPFPHAAQLTWCFTAPGVTAGKEGFYVLGFGGNGETEARAEGDLTFARCWCGAQALPEGVAVTLGGYACRSSPTPGR